MNEEDPRVWAAAQELWRIGNERIGHREWDEVAVHYLTEAAAALAAADVVDPLRIVDVFPIPAPVPTHNPLPPPMQVRYIPPPVERFR